MISKLILIAAMAALTGGCNTMRGVGQDIEAGGNKVEDVLKKQLQPRQHAKHALIRCHDQSRASFGRYGQVF